MAFVKIVLVDIFNPKKRLPVDVKLATDHVSSVVEKAREWIGHAKGRTGLRMLMFNKENLMQQLDMTLQDVGIVAGSELVAHYSLTGGGGGGGEVEGDDINEE